VRSAGQGNTGRGRMKPARWNFVETVAFIAFLIWTALGLIFTLKHITPGTIAHWAIPPELARFVEGCLGNGDPILILLAFASTHLHAVRQWNASMARRWAATIILCSYGIETLGASTGFPFGEYHYTTYFGPILGLVPMAIPFAWYVVVTNALFIVRAGAPNASRLTEAMVAGLICTLYDVILEPFATTVKHYWVWSKNEVPPLNYVAWFVISALLVWIFSPTIATRYRFDPRPFLILFFTVLIFFAGEFK